MSFASRLQQLKTSLESSAENDDSLISRLQTLSWVYAILYSGSSSPGDPNPGGPGVVTFGSDYFIDATGFVYKKLLLLDVAIFIAEGSAAAIVTINADINGQSYTPVPPENLYVPNDISGIHLDEISIDTTWAVPTITLPNVRKVNVAAGPHAIQYTRYFSIDSNGVLEPPEPDALFFTIPANSFAELEVKDSAQELWFRSTVQHSIVLEIIRRGMPLGILPPP